MRHFKIIVSISLFILMLPVYFYATVGPSIVRAQTATDSVVITLVVNQEIAISSPADINMSTNLGVAQNTAVGTTTWNVKTNDSAGYALSVKATSSPAMVSGSNSIADYQRGSPNTWNATSGSAYFGYSAFGSDTSTGTWGTGSVCSGATANSISTTLKYQGFATTSGTNIASRTATTTPSGIDTSVCYATEQNNFFIPSGTYHATVIATAIGN